MPRWSKQMTRPGGRDGRRTPPSPGAAEDLELGDVRPDAAPRLLLHPGPHHLVGQMDVAVLSRTGCRRRACSGLGSPPCSSQATGRCSRGRRETAVFLDAFEPPDGVDVVVCPPFTSLAAAVGRGVPVYAQNVHWAPEGAFTGEISAEMLLELGVEGAIVGHSERRQYFGETDDTVRLRCEAALGGRARVIACVGETEAEREAGETDAVLRRQVAGDPAARRARHRVRAGLGDRHRKDGDARARAGGARDRSRRCTRRTCSTAGSVKPENAAELMSAAGRRRGARRRRLARCRRRSRRSAARRDVSSGPLPLVTLVILDGWGIAPPGPGNAVELARTPVFDDLVARYPSTQLRASGAAVGLPEGQMGNSEVGHLTIGSGRILLQDLVRVSRAVEDGSLLENEALVGVFRRARERGADVHLLGLVSTGGVHSHIGHLRALLELARRAEMEDEDLDPRVHRRPRRLAACRRDRPRVAAARAHRHRRRPVLRDGPRRALGANRPGARRDRRRDRRERGRPRRGSAGELRARRDG